MKTVHIDLANVIEIARGDQRRFDRYLNQFVELVNSRNGALKEAIQKMDREAVRKVVHSMKPQLLFFGVKEVQEPIETIEERINDLPEDELTKICAMLSSRFEAALLEAKSVISESE